MSGTRKPQVDDLVAYAKREHAKMKNRAEQAEARLAAQEEQLRAVKKSRDEWVAKADQEQARGWRLERQLREKDEALTETLTYMERVRGGDPSLTSEEYYIVRDFARRLLSTPEAEPPDEDEPCATCGGEQGACVCDFEKEAVSRRLQDPEVGVVQGSED